MGTQRPILEIPCRLGLCGVKVSIWRVRFRARGLGPKGPEMCRIEFLKGSISLQSGHMVIVKGDRMDG
jgi:hypothetical protein